MSVKTLIEHHLEFLSFKRGCTGSSESTLVQMDHMSRLKCNISQKLIKMISSKSLDEAVQVLILLAYTSMKQDKLFS